MKKLILIVAMCAVCLSLSAQNDKRDGRAGNRKYKKGDYKEAEISYLKALVKDSLSLASNYNLASALYAQKDYQGAAEQLKGISEQNELSQVHYNMGNAALQMEDYASAVQAFKQSLLIDPEDLTAKESYIYAKEKLKDQQQQQQQQQDQNQDQNEDQNQDQQDQNDDQQQDQDQNQDQNQNDDSQNQNQDQQQQQNQQNQISKQQAQQMLRAIQAKEKETQDKVNKEKAALLQSQQKEKNW